MSAQPSARTSLIDGLTFLTTRRDGRVGRTGGLYHRDTRHLSDLRVGLEGQQFTFLGADTPSPRRRTLWYATDVSDVSGMPSEAADDAVPLVMTRDQVVLEGRGYAERLALENHSRFPYSGSLTVDFDVDFVDIFEVRGLRADTDRTVDCAVEEDAAVYEYGFATDAGEAVPLTTRVAFEEPPRTLVPGRATFPVDVAAQERFTVGLDVEVNAGTARTGVGEATALTSRGGAEGVDALSSEAIVRTGRAAYDRTFRRAVSDLRALVTHTDHGPVPLAGAPWYAAVFGRDSMIAAIQALPFVPEIAEGTLRFLAAHQGHREDDWKDEAPGKILHELRQGELARTGRVPHTPYYGSIDATPLWIVLLAETYRWTGNRELVDELIEPLESALGWIEAATASIGDGPFLYYRSTGEVDLPHKGWRDSARSVRFRDGRPATPPIASAEVQGYVYDALTRGAGLLRRAGGADDGADALEERARELREAFDASFWQPERGFYATALTRDGEPVDSVASNVGHCLWSGIVPAERAEDVVPRLLADDLYTGWGIRTTSAEDVGYSPVSYHTGSVWPHDTAFACLGMAATGHHDAAERVAEGLLDASTHFADHSLPEVFCGFDGPAPPKPYPSTCVPQAWAASAPFALLRSVFDLEPRTGERPVPGRSPSVVAEDALEPWLDRWQDGPPKVFDG